MQVVSKAGCQTIQLLWTWEDGSNCAGEDNVI